MSRVRTGSAAATRQNGPPLLVAGDPGKLHQPAHQPTLSPAAAGPRGVAAPADGIVLAQPLLDQEVVEQPHRHQTLLERRVRQPGPRVQSHNVGAPTARPRPQLPYMQSDMGPRGPHRVHALPLAQLQILRQPPGVGIDRPRRPPQVLAHLQPGRCLLMPTEYRPLLPQLDHLVPLIPSARGSPYETASLASDST